MLGVACHYYGAKNITHARDGKLCVSSGYYGAKVFLVLRMHATEWEQICGNNISLFGKGMR